MQSASHTQCLIWRAGDNQFKVRAFRNGASIIAEHATEITSSADMKGVKGIGKGCMDKVGVGPCAHSCA